MAPAGLDWARLNVDVARMGTHASEASELLRRSPTRVGFLILCDLLHGKKSVEATGFGVATIGAPEARGPRIHAQGWEDDLPQHRQ
jgi:hypothetical protein